MANSEHLNLLKQGPAQWNVWRQENPETKPDLSKAYLRRVNLRRANLSGADLSGADLIESDLQQADFSGAILTEIDLSMANLIMAKLSMVNLSGAKLNGADLIGANLISANLTSTNLIGADLNGADLIGTNLTDANLSMAQALATNFTEATLTGICLEDWNINSATRFENAICDYIYLQSTYEAFRVVFQERRPLDSNKTFVPGEFARLFQKIRSTAELIFHDGISWAALARAFKQLQVRAGREEIFIQALESRDNGEFVIAVNVPLGSDRAEIRQFVEQEYETALKSLENKYREQLQLRSQSPEEAQQQLDLERRKNIQLLQLVETMATKEVSKYSPSW